MQITYNFFIKFVKAHIDNPDGSAYQHLHLNGKSLCVKSLLLKLYKISTLFNDYLSRNLLPNISRQTHRQTPISYTGL